MSFNPQYPHKTFFPSRSTSTVLVVESHSLLVEVDDGGGRYYIVLVNTGTMNAVLPTARRFWLVVASKSRLSRGRDHNVFGSHGGIHVMVL